MSAARGGWKRVESYDSEGSALGDAGISRPTFWAGVRSESNSISAQRLPPVMLFRDAQTNLRWMFMS
jgi:hypothetical protein